MRAGSRFRALRHRNFRLFWLGQIVSLTGTWMQSVAQGWLIYRLSGSPLMLGFLGFAQFIPVLLLSLPAGVLADRVRKRRLIQVTQSLAMVQGLLLATLTSAEIVQPWMVLVLAFAFGTINAFDMPARQAFMVEMVGKEDISNAIALGSTAFNMARIVGPAVAGVIIARAGEGACFWLNGLSYIPVLVGLARMDARNETIHSVTAKPWQHLVDGLRHASTTAPIRNLLLLLGVMAGLGFQYMVLLPVYAREILGSGETAYGLLVTSFGLGSLLSALLLTQKVDRWGLRRFLLTGLLVASAGMLTFARSTDLALSLAAGFASGFGLILYTATTNTLIQMTTEDRYRGRVMSLYTLMFIGTAPLGSLTVGAIAERTDAPTATTFSGAVLLLGAIWIAYRLRVLARQEAEGQVSVPGPETFR